MAERGGQPGNQNARKGRIWSEAIERALSKRSRADQIEAIDVLAEKLLALCDASDLQALKEFGDRVEGKPTTVVDARGDMTLEIVWNDGTEGADPVPPETAAS